MGDANAPADTGHGDGDRRPDDELWRNAPRRAGDEVDDRPGEPVPPLAPGLEVLAPAAARPDTSVQPRPADWTDVPFTVAPRPSGLSAADISEERLYRPTTRPPTRGWRQLVHWITGGLVTPPPSRGQVAERHRLATLKTPIRGSRVIAMVSTKGGVGKTTTTVNLGHTFASHRGDRVVALDGNPDAGSLGYRIRLETPATADDLLTEIDGITRYADMRAFTSQASSRLEIVAAPDDPRVSNALGEPAYRRLLDLLEHHYQLILVDCGTGILDDATRGIVELADQLVVVTAPSIDSVRATSYLLDWLESHDHADLVADAVAVVNGCRGGRDLVDLDEIDGHFALRCRSVVRIPWDRHLAAGGTTGLELISARAREAYVRLAAAVAEGFASPPIV